MAPLIILLAVFGLSFVGNKFFLKKPLEIPLIGRLSLAVMLLFTGIAHFTSTSLMAEMIPDVIPFKKGLVYLSGAFEIIAAVGLLTKRFSRFTSLMLILFFLMVLPANIAGSIKEVPLGGMKNGVNYLYFRIPLQLFFILWAYYFGVKTNR